MRGTILFRWPCRCMAHLGMIWIVSSRGVFVFSTIGDREVIYPCLFTFNFSNNMLVLLFNVLQPLLQRKIMLAGDVCSRPPITMGSHNLHACDIRRAMDEITSYHKRVQFFFFFFGSCKLFVFWPFFGLPFLSPL